jgi:hypothetical protein
MVDLERTGQEAAVHTISDFDLCLTQAAVSGNDGDYPRLPILR